MLRQRLSILHHSLGSDIVDPATAAELEQGIIAVTSSSGPKGPHRSRPIESTLRNLSQMKNAARKNIGTHCDRFVHLVRAHHTA